MRKPSPNIDYTSRDYEAFRETLLNRLTVNMPEYTDTSQTDAGIVILEGFSNGLDILSLYLDVIANDVILLTTQDRRIACLISRILGYTPYNQTTSLTKQVFVLNATKDSDVIIPAGTVVKTHSDNEEAIPPILFETVDNLKIPAGALGDEQDGEGNYLYTVDVAQGETIKDDIVGSSNGSPYQTFTLSYQNVLVDTLRVYVEEEETTEEWTRVENFISSDIDADSRVFTVSTDDYDNCTIEFGNGVKGKIPPAIDSGIICDYRIGGGNSSNVAANTITELESDVENIERTFNPEASYYRGHDKEPIEEIKVNAPANFRVRERIVTLQDYEDILMIENDDFYGIWRVKAITDDLDGLQVNLYMQMREDYVLTEELKEEVAEYVEDHAMIGTSCTVNDHTDTVLNLEANLGVHRDYKRAEVQALVEAFITSYFSGTEFTFDDVFISSDLEQEVMTNIEGINFFRILSPDVDEFKPESEESIITLGTITLEVSGGIVDE